LGFIRSVFQFVVLIGGIMVFMCALQVVMSFFGYTYEIMEDLGDPTMGGVIIFVVSLVFLGVGKGVDWVFGKIQDRQTANSLKQK
jgi:hypothetical protein